jgi:riboflavin biosynthesis pyrimidine reductase
VRLKRGLARRSPVGQPLCGFDTNGDTAATHAQSLHRLYPQPAAALTAAQAVAGLDPGAAAVADRPYVICNFVATVDGKATVGGRSGPLGDQADHELFQRLRARVDAVLVGAGTMRIERYGRLMRDPELRSARERAGLRPDPLACVVTRSPHLPVEIPIFQDRDSTIAVYTSATSSFPATPARVEVTRMAPGQLTMTAVLRHLRHHHGVRSILCEGGPTVLGLLLAEELLDEFFLTVSTKLAGGLELPISTGQAAVEPAELRLMWVLEHRGSLFLRYAVTHR